MVFPRPAFSLSAVYTLSLYVYAFLRAEDDEPPRGTSTNADEAGGG